MPIFLPTEAYTYQIWSKKNLFSHFEPFWVFKALKRVVWYFWKKSQNAGLVVQKEGFWTKCQKLTWPFSLRGGSEGSIKKRVDSNIGTLNKYFREAIADLLIKKPWKKQVSSTFWESFKSSPERCLTILSMYLSQNKVGGPSFLELKNPLQRLCWTFPEKCLKKPCFFDKWKKFCSILKGFQDPNQKSAWGAPPQCWYVKSIF